MTRRTTMEAKQEILDTWINLLKTKYNFIEFEKITKDLYDDLLSKATLSETIAVFYDLLDLKQYEEIYQLNRKMDAINLQRLGIVTTERASEIYGDDVGLEKFTQILIDYGIVPFRGEID